MIRLLRRVVRATWMPVAVALTVGLCTLLPLQQRHEQAVGQRLEAACRRRRDCYPVDRGRRRTGHAHRRWGLGCHSRRRAIERGCRRHRRARLHSFPRSRSSTTGGNRDDQSGIGVGRPCNLVDQRRGDNRARADARDRPSGWRAKSSGVRSAESNEQCQDVHRVDHRPRGIRRLAERDRVHRDTRRSTSGWARSPAPTGPWAHPRCSEG